MAEMGVTNPAAGVMATNDRERSPLIRAPCRGEGDPELVYYARPINTDSSMGRYGSEDDFRAVCARVRAAGTKADLAAVLYREIACYSLYDLQDLRGMVERDLAHVPDAYRLKLYPRIMEQIFGTHHALVRLTRNGDLDRLHGSLDGRFREFCDMVERACRARTTARQRRLELLYFLLAAFNLFVLDLPGHPVGTPFPGGLEVEVRDGEYLCPIRERADDVENALCPYCPAKQSDG